MKETTVGHLKKFLPVLIAILLFPVPLYIFFYPNAPYYSEPSFGMTSLFQSLILVILNLYLYKKNEKDLAFFGPAISALFGAITGIALGLFLTITAIIPIDLAFLLQNIFSSVYSAWVSYIFLFLFYIILGKKFIPSFSKKK